MAIRSTKKSALTDIDKIVTGNFPNAKAGAFINVNNLNATDDESSGGEADGTTGTGAPGSGEPLFDLSVFGLTGTAEMLLAEMIRKGEANFGIVPDTRDPDKQRRAGNANTQGPQRHPLLSESQRFDGADPKLNALPSDNPEANERYRELANELRPGARPTNTYVETPTFKPI